MKILTWFDSWVDRGPFTPSDVAIYRIVFILLLFPYLPRLSELGTYPKGLLDAPPGPFAMLGGFPPVPVLVVMEIVLAIAAVATLFGIFTRTASVVLSVLLFAGYGLVFSLGKIDHLAVMMSVPAIMSFARWGDSFSLDSIRRKRRSQPGGSTADALAASANAGQPQWPLRFLATAIGVAFMTAAMPKVASGWLDLSTQATYGQVTRSFGASGAGPLSEVLIKMPIDLLWEPLDWITVLLEVGVLASVLSWKWWRAALSVLTLFHLGIGLSLGILFAVNLIAYGAFVSWGKVRRPAVRFSARSNDLLARFGPPAVLILGVVMWLVGDALWSVRAGVSALIVVVAAIGGAAYLVSLGLTLTRRLRRARGARATEVG